MKTAIALAAILAATPAMAQQWLPGQTWDQHVQVMDQQAQIDRLQQDQRRAHDNYQMDQLNAWTAGQPSSYGQGTLYR